MQKNSEQIVIGIDPGTANMGYSLLLKKGNKLSLLKYGCITTSAKTALPKRLAKINSELKKILKKYKPEVMAIENLFFSKNVKTAISVAQARGVALLSAAQADIETFSYNPQQVKQAVTGYGRADKKQVQEMTKRLLNLSKIPKPDDAADAIAIAYCHLQSARNYNIKQEF
ncbi:crossover junction endodeoxyribonuclease RuvC [Candidatus Margulisiibacteriota bacterium]